ncbi:SSI family serine proteinase inhibitor [Streptomyces aurantiacus]|uniref:Putative Subtilisin inhibitor n=1 Tax=Streptomyces aurantiacus JA 4570 TaxID=1286094 RepID=S3ZD91_9ACTN|nr:SSI family serine proteinase inhibitor [Streptomyces aurantiacus]EPH41646.1 putative Subtilisin inhibitor [Streptomyces aurantiacus JA 4570]
MKTTTKITATLLALGVSAVLAGTAQATGPGAPDRTRAAAPAELTLTLTRPQGDAAGSRTATLKCGPTGGTHPAARSACAELGARNGTIEQKPADGVCTMIYSPVVAEATGTYNGRPVSFKKKYGNDCEMHQHTGAVFEF